MAGDGLWIHVSVAALAAGLLTATRASAGCESSNFRGYVAVAYALTGEARNWNPSSGVFSGLKPAKALTFDGKGFGAWEIALRYSFADLGFRNDLPVAAGGIFGGQQSAWSTGGVTPPAGAQVGQDLQIVSLRTQFTF